MVVILEYNIEKIKESNRTFFIEMLPYVSGDILDFRVNNNIIEIDYQKTENKEQIIQKLNKLQEISVEEKIQNSDSIKTKLLFDKTDIKTINKKPVFDQLKENGDIYEIGEGTFAYSGLFLKIFNYFYNKVKDFSKQEFNASEIKFPILFPLNKFEQGGYFETFPHHIMFQTAINSDIDILNKFAKEGVSPEILKNIKSPENVLTNAACGPLYPMLSGKKIKHKDSPLIFYVSGKCFRNESSNIYELARLNEFNMSEIVAIGEEKELYAFMDKAKEFWTFLMNKFNFNCKIETANDSFFAGNYKKLKFFQLLGNSKEEFSLLLPHVNKYLSCSSVNYHRTHFTKRYDISTEKGNCHTVCIAFGIERLAYSFLCQYGYNSDNWGEEIKNEIEQYVSEYSIC